MPVVLYPCRRYADCLLLIQRMSSEIEGFVIITNPQSYGLVLVDPHNCSHYPSEAQNFEVEVKVGYLPRQPWLWSVFNSLSGGARSG